MAETSDGPVVLETRITLWSEERLELTYELSNGGGVPIVVWDEAPGDTFGATPTDPARSVTDVIVEDGSPVLFKGVVPRDDCLNPAGPITVTGRALADGGTLDGALVRALPLASRCESLFGTDVAELRFCVGYSLADSPELAEALSFGRAQSGEERYASGLIGEQRRSCVTLSR